MFTFRSLLVALFLSLFLAIPAGAEQSIRGTLKVVDADTFRLGNNKIRLFGVDAPEADQTCKRPNGRVWKCGDWATRQVRKAFGGRRASCAPVTTDRYGRIVARCSVNGQDLGEALVSAGLAFAYRRYSNDYAVTEKAAAIAGRGLWGSDFVAPAEHRASKTQGDTAPDQSCNIKGNISASGRIYHRPGNRDYDRTRISARKGERWFCSEAEARAAGWRAARN